MANRVIAFLDFLYSMGLGGVIEAKLKVIGKNKKVRFPITGQVDNEKVLVIKRNKVMKFYLQVFFRVVKFLVVVCLVLLLLFVALPYRHISNYHIVVVSDAVKRELQLDSSLCDKMMLKVWNEVKFCTMLSCKGHYEGDTLVVSSWFQCVAFAPQRWLDNGMVLNDEILILDRPVQYVRCGKWIESVSRMRRLDKLSDKPTHHDSKEYIAKLFQHASSYVNDK